LTEFLGNGPEELQPLVERAFARNLCRATGATRVSLVNVLHPVKIEEWVIGFRLVLQQPTVETIRAANRLQRKHKGTLRRVDVAYDFTSSQFEDMKADAVVRAWNSPDLTPADQKRVAKLVATEIDAVRDLHAVPGPDRSLENIAESALPSADDPGMAGLTLRSLLAS